MKKLFIIFGALAVASFILWRLAPKQAHLEACDSPKEILLDFRGQNLLARYQRLFYSL
jgi:hypothetical protein